MGNLAWRAYVAAVVGYAVLIAGMAWYFGESGPGAGAPYEVRAMAVSIVLFVGVVAVLVFIDPRTGRARGPGPR